MGSVTDIGFFNHLVDESHRNRIENARVNRLAGACDPGDLGIRKPMANLLCKTKLQDAVADDLLTSIDEDGFRVQCAYRQFYRRYF